MEKNYRTTEVAKLIGPLPLSNFKQKIVDEKEYRYASNKQAPLGRAPPSNIPPQVNALRFGFVSEKGDSAGDLMYPSRFDSPIPLSLYSEDYDCSKQSSNEMDPAGVKEFHDNTGRQTKEAFTMNSEGESAKIVPIWTDSLERNVEQNLNEEKLDFNASTPKYTVMGIDNTYGFLDPVKVQPKRYRKEKNLIEVLWNMLKMKNHCNFKDFTSAFNAYDRENSGKITADDVQVMCQKFGISVPMQVIQKLVAECDVLDKDGTLDYQEFVHCLNWKDMLPGNLHKRVGKYGDDWRQGINNPPQDIIDHYKTVTSSIGDHSFQASPKTAGIPSFRTDKIQPCLKSVCDYSEYGDVKDISVLIQPNIFAECGVYEKDLAQSWSKYAVMTFFKKSGLLIDEEEFETLWKSINKNEKASIGAVLNALKWQF